MTLGMIPRDLDTITKAFADLKDELAKEEAA
jgi:hypothetical protein